MNLHFRTCLLGVMRYGKWFAFFFFLKKKGRDRKQKGLEEVDVVETHGHSRMGHGQALALGMKLEGGRRDTRMLLPLGTRLFQCYFSRM